MVSMLQRGTKIGGAHSNSFLSITLKVDVFNQVDTKKIPKEVIYDVKTEGDANHIIYPSGSMPHQGYSPAGLSSFVRSVS